MRVTRDELLDRYVGAPPGTAVVDCRTPSEFAGRDEPVLGLPLPHHRLGGHVPGAVNVSGSGLLDEGGCLRPRDDHRAAFTGQGVHPDADVGVHCDVGGRSSLGWFVRQELLVHPRVRSGAPVSSDAAA